MLRPPIEPMLASLLGSSLPADDPVLQYEPKWDGFRCLVFRDGDAVVLQGRGRSRGADEAVDLGYAFPELVASIRDQLPAQAVLDGEIVVAVDGRLDFSALAQRLRPRSEAAGPNIDRLAATVPAALLLFDVLHLDEDLTSAPLAQRRARLESLARTLRPPLLLTPVTADQRVAQRWFDEFEAAGVDGVMVKRRDEPYQPGKRVQGKVKHRRTVDVVVAGWRAHTRSTPDGEPVVGSLLLGLMDADGRLQYVGGASAFTMSVRAQLRELLRPLELADDAPHPWRGAEAGRRPGEASRWRREQPWVAVRPTLVAEVAYDQMIDDRFRHTAAFLRWRPDRTAQSCGLDQLEQPAFTAIERLLATT